MTAAVPATPAPIAQFLATPDGCHVNTSVLFRRADGVLELVEWAPDELVTKEVTFDEAQKLAKKCSHAGGSWQVGDPKEWTTAFDYSKEGPASDLPGLTSDVYWTCQPDPSSSDVAFAVGADIGNVHWFGRHSRFRVRFCRRVPASQFLNLG